MSFLFPGNSSSTSALALRGPGFDLRPGRSALLHWRLKWDHQGAAVSTLCEKVVSVSGWRVCGPPGRNGWNRLSGLSVLVQQLLGGQKPDGAKLPTLESEDAQSCCGKRECTGVLSEHWACSVWWALSTSVGLGREFRRFTGNWQQATDKCYHQVRSWG